MDCRVRSSQRMARSCAFCTKRKIKCDKDLPCLACRRRGKASHCRIEPVVVKGRLIHDDVLEAQPSYQSLQDEVERLRGLLEERKRAHGFQGRARVHSMHAGERMLYQRLRDHQRPVTTISSAADVRLVSATASRGILAHARGYNMWLHCHSELCQLEEEVELLYRRLQIQSLDEAADPAWLAFYFANLAASLLSMTADTASTAGIDYDSIFSYMSNWFHASLYFLHRSDFLRLPTLQTIQTILALEGLFIHLGEFSLMNNLWACAIRISQLLGINSDQNNEDESRLERQRRRHILWSLVATDWLCAPLGVTCVDDADISVDFPSSLDYPEIVAGRPLAPAFAPRRMQYQLVMFRIGSEIRNFQKSLAQQTDLGDVVAESDNALAQIISDLPPHLTPEYGGAAESTEVLEWEAWQRESIGVVLLYYRMVINHVMKECSIPNSPLHQTAVAICHDSAHAIVQRVLFQTMPPEHQLEWSIVLPMFTAAATLLEEHIECEQEHQDIVRRCIGFFQRLEFRSLYATFAIQTLQELLRLNDVSGVVTA